MKRVSDKELAEMIAEVEPFEDMCNTADFVSALKELRQLRGQWVSVKERLPENLRDLTLESVKAFIEHAEELEVECLYCRGLCDSHHKECVISLLRDYVKRLEVAS